MCSNTKNGGHILMWDFDDTTYGKVAASLLSMQKKYQLPRITILETKEGTNFCAYCFEELPWPCALAIVLDTPGICWNFFRLSVIRGYFTLRYDEKRGYRPNWRAEIPGKTQARVGVEDLVHAMKYETSRRRD